MASDIFFLTDFIETFKDDAAFEWPPPPEPIEMGHFSSSFLPQPPDDYDFPPSPKHSDVPPTPMSIHLSQADYEIAAANDNYWPTLFDVLDMTLVNMTLPAGESMDWSLSQFQNYRPVIKTRISISFGNALYSDRTGDVAQGVPLI